MLLRRADSLSLAIATQTDSSVAVVLVLLYKRKILRLKPQYDDIFSVILSEVKNLFEENHFVGSRPNLRYYCWQEPTRDILVFLFKINSTHNFMQQKRTAFQQSYNLIPAV